MFETLNLYKCTSHRSYHYFLKVAKDCNVKSYRITRDSATSFKDWTVGGCSTYFIHVEGTLPDQALQYAKPYTLRKGFKASACW
jgi:hypothetical protein